ncbi:MAG TPA: phosphatase [Cyclobacteriaceae bacterium]|nr:phosphatase [Cyclobacteriaceae bacterium]
MNLISIADQYIQQGGEFVSPPSHFVEKMKPIRVVLFDWDGVFNDGFKRGEEGSIFSEVDAMGTNLLRYALWRAHGTVPVSAIMTGEQNPSAVHFAKRENFTAAFTGTKNKGKAFQLFCEQYKCTPQQVLFFGDDVLDLDVARQCGVRIIIGRKSGVLFKQWVSTNHLADYITACDGGNHGLREAAEMIMGLAGWYDEVISNRMVFSDNYQKYLAERKTTATNHVALP